MSQRSIEKTHRKILKEHNQQVSIRNLKKGTVSFKYMRQKSRASMGRTSNAKVLIRRFKGQHYQISG